MLLSFGEKEPAPVERPEPAFPTGMRAEEWRRREERATLELPAPPPPPGAPAALVAAMGPVRRDPLHVALPARRGDPVVVFEANALRHSRLGELFVSCLLARDPDAFASIERSTGVDVLKDIDRVAFVGDTVVVSGFFDRARWSELEANDGQLRTYGAAGRIYEHRGGREVVGVWKDQIMLLGEDPATVERALDQLEGRAPVPPSAIPEDLAYGEVYGVVPGEAAQKLLRGASGELADRIAAAASRIELHVDAMSDVAAVVRVRGAAGSGLEDLARSAGAALAVARVEAQATNDRQLSEILEFARVQPGATQFSIELALPADRLEKWFEGCPRGLAGGPRAPARARAFDDDPAPDVETDVERE